MTFTLEQVLTIIGLLGIGAAAYARLSAQIAENKLKTDTIWQFSISRAFLESKDKGDLTANSPVVVAPEVVRWFRELMPEMVRWYRTLKKPLRAAPLSLMIERKWRLQLIEQVCKPHGFHNGRCLVVAATMVKNACGEQVDDSEFLGEGK